ncbi:MAG: DUF2845 domain-containing protein [Methylophaga sp.]|nr:DUF2845 domain-containing protein [Methylophaga sp.]
MLLSHPSPRGETLMRLTSKVFMTLAGMFSSAVLAGSADLSSLPCGTQAITLGMSPQQIKSTCGQAWEPSYISKHKRPALGDEEGHDLFEKWMYSTADSKATHVIFKNGEVVRIFTLR